MKTRSPRPLDEGDLARGAYYRTLGCSLQHEPWTSTGCWRTIKALRNRGNLVPWWAWLVVGGVLLALELTFIDAAFYLAFLGAAAVLVGIIEVGGAELPLWGQWLLYAVLAVVTMVLFRKRLYDKMRGELPGYDATPVGAEVTVKEAVPRRWANASASARQPMDSHQRRRRH